MCKFRFYFSVQFHIILDCAHASTRFTFIYDFLILICHCYCIFVVVSKWLIEAKWWNLIWEPRRQIFEFFFLLLCFEFCIWTELHARSVYSDTIKMIWLLLHICMLYFALSCDSALSPHPGAVREERCDWPDKTINDNKSPHFSTK